MQDWAVTEADLGSADTIMCLSVTKWVHLNAGDAGLLAMFAKFAATLSPGGLLVLEPQPWRSYRAALHKQARAGLAAASWTEVRCCFHS